LDLAEGFEEVIRLFQAFSGIYMVLTIDKEVLVNERFSAGSAHYRFFYVHKISMGHL